MTGKRSETASLTSHSQAKRPRQGIEGKPVLNEDHGTLRLHRRNMTGQLPSFNDYHSAVADHEHGRLYIYGGSHPAAPDAEIIPTSDLYRCDTVRMEWTSLTVRALKYDLHPCVIFPQDKLHFRPRPDNEATQRLPALHQPATMFVTLNKGSFLYIFGGRDITGKELSIMLAVDLDNLDWWVVHIDGGPVAPRRAADMTAIDNKLYIFGGVQESTHDDQLLASFCIAEYDKNADRWSWIVRDQQYPDHVSSMGHQSLITPVYGGKKILLMSGRANDTEVSSSFHNASLLHKY